MYVIQRLVDGQWIDGDGSGHDATFRTREEAEESLEHLAESYSKTEWRIVEHGEPQTAGLTREDKIALGQLTTRDDAGRHYSEWIDADWLAQMEDAGLVRINRPVHEATGIPYSQEYHTLEVADVVATWFDEQGDLIDD